MKQLPTLNRRIAVLFGALVVVTSLSLILVSWLSAHDHTRKQIASDLAIGRDVFLNTFRTREEVLLVTAQVLTDDFGFKQAAATGDANTIKSSLINHGARIQADLMGLIDLSGQVVAGTLEDNALASSVRQMDINKIILEGGRSDIISVNGQPYQSILLTVDAPNPIAIAWVGFAIDQSLLKQLSEITRLSVTVTSRANVFPPVSSIDQTLLQTVLSQQNSSIPLMDSLFEYENKYASIQFSLREESQSASDVSVILSQSLEDAISDINTLIADTATISIGAILASILAAIAFSKRLARPIVELNSASRRIAHGDYQSKIAVDPSSVEIASLAQSFAWMQAGIAERESQIRQQAEQDTLTGLYNRAKIVKLIDELEISNADIQVVHISINEFREINETFGFQIGDRCIMSVADITRELGGTAAHLSGAEFIWMPEQVADNGRFAKIAKEFTANLEKNQLNTNVSLSFSTARFPKDADCAKDLLRKLSIAASQARHNRDFIQVYHRELEDIYTKRVQVLHELNQQLSGDADELLMHYQPKMSLSDNTVTRFEALIRWNSQSLGFVSPEWFIPIAEKAGIIIKLSEWVVDRVIKDLSLWDLGGVKIAINLSVHDIHSPDLLNHVLGRLEHYQLPRDSLSFEITESDVMVESDNAINVLKTWNTAGFDLSIDDFGTGHSSLAYVKNLPVQELKVDKSFVLELAQREEDQKIVTLVVDLAKKFNLQVVAEGVEDRESLEFLRGLGCEWIQGYYISRPLHPKDVISWLNSFDFGEKSG